MNHKNQRIVEYDLIRSIATLMIVAYHFEAELDSKGIQLFSRSITSWRGAGWGGIGVFLFFVLSGAVHCVRYSGEISYREYYRSRLKSIFPMFYITYLLAAVLEIITKGDTFTKGVEPWKFLLTLLACDGYFPQLGDTFYLVGEWFTTVILFVYAIFPLVRIAIKKNPLLYWIILVALDIFFFFDVWNPLEITYGGNCFLGITAFSIGYVWREMKQRWTVLVMLSAVVIGGTLTVIDYSSPITNIMLAVSIWGMVTWLFDKMAYSDSIVGKASLTIAKYSYAIYLTHHFIIRKIVATNGHPLEMLVWVTILTIAGSYVTYNLNRYLLRR